MGNVTRIDLRVLNSIPCDLTRYPFPGHFVRIQTQLYRTVPIGSLGLILGRVGDLLGETDIAFNPTPHLLPDPDKVGRWLVLASGGPITDQTSMANLVSTGDTVTTRFRIKDRFTRKIRVPVWEWWPPERY